MPFVDLDKLNYVPLDAARLEQAVFDGLAERFPGWEPAPGNLETVLVERLASIGADLADLAVDVPPEIFRGFGEKIIGLAPQLALSATVSSTWTMVDDAGYTIPAGTPVALQATGSDLVGFVTQAEVIVPAGETATDPGGVTLVAAVPGSAPNGLEDLDVVVLDNLAFVESVDMVGEVTGGVDEEDPDAYLDRLADDLRTLAPRPILPEDFAILARNVTGVWRAVAIDGFDPGDSSTGNERMVAVAALDENGVGVGSTVRSAIDALLEGEREVNFVVNVIEPTVTQVKVSVTATALPGYDPADVDVAVETAIANYLSPARWGLDLSGQDPRAWRNVTTVRRFELIALVDRVPGVDYITALTLAKQADSLGTSDVTLTGAAPIVSPGTISATVS